MGPAAAGARGTGGSRARRGREDVIQLKRKVRLALEAAAGRKAEDPVALSLKGIATFTDAFVICSGNQRRQTQAICDAIVEALAAAGEPSGHVEGYAAGEWILIDCGDLVIHVFTRDTRSFYNLEKLWGDAKHLSLEKRQSRGNRGSSAARKG